MTMKAAYRFLFATLLVQASATPTSFYSDGLADFQVPLNPAKHHTTSPGSPHTQSFFQNEDALSFLHDVETSQRTAQGFAPLDLHEERQVQFEANGPVFNLTEWEKLYAKSQGYSFMDITDYPNLGQLGPKQQFSYPSTVNQTKTVKSLISLLSTEGPRKNLEHFTSFHTRYYNSKTGRMSARWLFGQIEKIIESHANAQMRGIISLREVRHKWMQNSIVVQLEPPAASLADPVTILGAHIDSINHQNVFSRAPGADDDGSGTVTLLEVLRVMLVNGYVPTTPLEFHFYAAEEVGLYGSQDIASTYETQGRVVKAMLQFDTVGWHKAGTREVIGLITNEVDLSLVEYLKVLTEEYIGLPWHETHYPVHAGSDHMSWMKAGYQAAQAIEGDFNETSPNVHGPNDAVEFSKEFSFDHLLHFAALAVAFAVELTS